MCATPKMQAGSPAHRDFPYWIEWFPNDFLGWPGADKLFFYTYIDTHTIFCDRVPKGVTNS